MEKEKQCKLMRIATVPSEVWLPEVTMTKAMPVKEMLPTAMSDSVILWEWGKMYLRRNNVNLDKEEVQDKQHNSVLRIRIKKDTMMVIRLWLTMDTPNQIIM